MAESFKNQENIMKVFDEIPEPMIYIVALNPKPPDEYSAMAKESTCVIVIIAVGQIGDTHVPMIARGVMLGPDQPVILHVLDIPPTAEALNGEKMDLVDVAFPSSKELLLQLMLLRHVLASTLQLWSVVSLGKKAWKGKM